MVTAQSNDLEHLVQRYLGCKSDQQAGTHSAVRQRQQGKRLCIMQTGFASLHWQQKHPRFEAVNLQPGIGCLSPCINKLLPGLPQFQIKLADSSSLLSFPLLLLILHSLLQFLLHCILQSTNAMSHEPKWSTALYTGRAAFTCDNIDASRVLGKTYSSASPTEANTPCAVQLY